MESQEQNFQTQSNWLPFFLFLLFVYCKDINKLNFREIDPVDLDKKSKLLNRIKEYMDPQGQHVVHSAEIILQIIAKIKILMELPQTGLPETKYSTLSLEDKKHNMLAGLEKFLENEISELVSTDEKKEKAAEFKRLTSILKIINSMKGKEKINESDIVEIVQPFVGKGQDDSLIRLIQTFKIIENVRDEGTAPIN